MDIEELLGFAKRTGFFWPAAEIYGGTSGIFDYGHLGALMRRKFEDAWLNFFVYRNENYYPIEGSNILPEKPLVASGHASRFNDVIVGCSKCKSYYRADVLLNDMKIPVAEGANASELGEVIKKNGVKCPKCSGMLLEPKAFNMMIGVSLGPEKGELGYLRPETAQSVYLNFFREFNILRKRLPIGLAIIGRAYRNEISPRQGLYRMRELTQAELQIFFDPDTFNPTDNDRLLERKLNVILYVDKKERVITGNELVASFNIPKFYAYHMGLIDYFYKEVLSIKNDRMRFLEKGGEDKAFYNKVHMDIEINVDSWNGFKEVGGLHYRSDYDLTSHSKGSNIDLSVNINGKKIMPNVLELSFGVDRNLWMLVDQSLIKDEDRSIFKIKRFLAPYAFAILPLQKDDNIIKVSRDIYENSRKIFNVYFDESGSIGRRYARMDEIGTPFCITIDFNTVDSNSNEYNTVTIRERDSKKQERIKISDISEYVSKMVKFGY